MGTATMRAVCVRASVWQPFEGVGIGEDAGCNVFAGCRTSDHDFVHDNVLNSKVFLLARRYRLNRGLALICISQHSVLEMLGIKGHSADQVNLSEIW